ncbi:S-layer homology domain-containing protein [Paenibacillus alba]|uniref:S-layer homology domain-containing protein n=1 Tax=Paenibacillus alba TaxID=1197127 RepID=A0ABU6G5S0_9BACL|nr:S-layer homology domain-containing protein [Paenibacillus alba]MEC0229496.1 S-layer homology domain-containing protein [Paenibacillus alba]
MGLRRWLTSSMMFFFLTSMILTSVSAAASEISEAPAYAMKISNKSVAKGDTIEVLIQGSHLKDVYAFEVNLVYDPTRLKLKDAKTDIPGFSVNPIIKDTNIQLAHTQVGKAKGLNGEQQLFKVHLEAIRSGNVELMLSSVNVVDSALASSALQIDSKLSLAIQSPYRFDDLDDFEWAISAIEALAAKGIVTGMAERMFSPASSVTRADFVLLLMRTLQLKGTTDHQFEDVQDGLYYAEPLTAARSLGIVEGDEGNNFHPQDSLTREDMVVLTNRALRASNHLSTHSSLSVLETFNDYLSISDYAADSVADFVQLGLLEGYSNGIHPKETSNRAQAAMLVSKLVTFLGK